MGVPIEIFMYHFIFFISFALSQFPIDLNQYETCSGTIQIGLTPLKYISYA